MTNRINRSCKPRSFYLTPNIIIKKFWVAPLNSWLASLLHQCSAKGRLGWAVCSLRGGGLSARQTVRCPLPVVMVPHSTFARWHRLDDPLPLIWPVTHFRAFLKYLVYKVGFKLFGLVGFWSHVWSIEILFCWEWPLGLIVITVWSSDSHSIEGVVLWVREELRQVLVLHSSEVGLWHV